MEAYIVEVPDGNFRKVDLPRPTLKVNHVLVSSRTNRRSCRCVRLQRCFASGS